MLLLKIECWEMLKTNQSVSQNSEATRNPLQWSLHWGKWMFDDPLSSSPIQHDWLHERWFTIPYMPFISHSFLLLLLLPLLFSTRTIAFHFAPHSLECTAIHSALSRFLTSLIIFPCLLIAISRLSWDIRRRVSAMLCRPDVAIRWGEKKRSGPFALFQLEMMWCSCLRAVGCIRCRWTISENVCLEAYGSSYTQLAAFTTLGTASSFSTLLQLLFTVFFLQIFSFFFFYFSFFYSFFFYSFFFYYFSFFYSFFFYSFFFYLIFVFVFVFVFFLFFL